MPNVSPADTGASAGTLVTTRTGLQLLVRPAEATDEPLLTELFEHLTLEDIRFRFLSSVHHVGHEQIAAMLRVDHERSETLLAFDRDSGELVATAMLAADPDLARAEVAISVHRDFKGRGIGWTLLHHVVDLASERGIARLQSIESRDNHEAIEVERDVGFTAQAYPGDSTLMLIEIRLDQPATGRS